jgi:hypothetical protein
MLLEKTGALLACLPTISKSAQKISRTRVEIINSTTSLFVRAVVAMWYRLMAIFISRELG